MPDVRREGPTALLLCMMGIVACNVRFVQLTEAADPLWLAMLYVVTLAAPFLLRFRESLLYRSAWNVGIVLFFLRLVQHASTAELEFVLDDGLLLALLCQVHVLNNLREEQRPDLLFLNSFLIAVITGYITVDMSFAVTFLVYAPLFVLGLHGLPFEDDARRAAEIGCDEMHFLPVPDSGWSIALLRYRPRRDPAREALVTQPVSSTDGAWDDSDFYRGGGDFGDFGDCGRAWRPHRDGGEDDDDVGGGVRVDADATAGGADDHVGSTRHDCERRSATTPTTGVWHTSAHDRHRAHQNHPSSATCDSTLRAGVADLCRVAGCVVLLPG